MTADGVTLDTGYGLDLLAWAGTVIVPTWYLPALAVEAPR